MIYKYKKFKNVILFPLPMVSHIMQLETVARVLQSRGYNIYVVMNDGVQGYDKKLQKNGFNVMTFNVDKDIETRLTQLLVKMKYIAFGDTIGLLEIMIESPNLLQGYCRAMLADESLMKTLKRLKFEAALVDDFLVMPCLMVAAYSLSIPMVLLGCGISEADIGSPAPPSIHPDVHTSFTQNMNFLERFCNTLISYALHSEWSPTKGGMDLLEKYTDLGSWASLYSKADLVIILRDYHLEYPVPAMPNTLYLPGISYRPAVPIPEDLQQFSDKYHNGLIVFSFGSTVEIFPTYIVEKFFTAFLELKDIGVVWRLVGGHESLEIPENVKLVPSMPQNDLLGHNNTALFITHCGNNGQYESVYHGVPMLGFPLFGDQHHNAVRMEYHKLGKQMNIKQFTDRELVTNLRLLTMPDSVERQRAKMLAAILKSYPLPSVRAADAIDHVMSFGSGHLKSVTMEMPVYKLFMWDIFAFLLLTLLILACLFGTCLYCCYKRRLFRKFKKG